VSDLPEWLSRLFAVLLQLLPAGLWCAWWLWAVNWKKTWPVLARGAWVPVVLLMLVAAGVWSRLAPGPYSGLGVVTIPNFWWQLGGVGALAAAALFCGYLQGYFGWEPAEIDLELPAPAHGHDHH
jgi:hypothetical protein